MKNNELQAIIEGLLYISGDDGIDIPAIQEVLPNEKPSNINEIIDRLNEKYQKDDSCAFSIQKFHKNKFRLQTKKILHVYLTNLSQFESKHRLTNSVIEVLSIIAYRGPITRGQIDDLRNPDSSYQLQRLRELELIQATGKSEENPRANIYQITDNFFKIFNLNSVEDMPKVDFDNVQVQQLNETDKTQNLKNIFNRGEFDDE